MAKISSIMRPFKKDLPFKKDSPFKKDNPFKKERNSFLKGHRAHPLSNRDCQWIRLVETVQTRPPWTKSENGWSFLKGHSFLNDCRGTAFRTAIVPDTVLSLCHAQRDAILMVIG